eukprot:TRINITY_DN13873_c0_g2_i1.p1 TRINITY_DN13873_c0_g2~~TRINITY_DN13873_c0_g2_i1.p1  ORF type:complete len:1197 (+),score=326.93 TRINITY_DN13873_c0_g2_i1:87-3593(+)
MNVGGSVAVRRVAPRSLIEAYGTRPCDKAKALHEVEYLKNLFYKHSAYLDEKLYYLAKTYAQMHRIEMKQRKGEKKREGQGRLLSGQYEQVVVLEGSLILLISHELPTRDTVEVSLPFLEAGKKARNTVFVHAPQEGVEESRHALYLRPVDAGVTAALREHHGKVYGKGRWEEVRIELEEVVETWKDRLANFLENPFSSRMASAFFLIQVVLILLSVVALLMETIPAYNPEVFPEFEMLWWWIELVVTAVFTIETCARFYTSDERCNFCKRPTNIADILAVVPFYLELVMVYALNTNSTAAVSALKICRLLRMLKFFRNFGPIENLVRALEKSAQALLAPMLFLVACLLVMSSVMYFVEKGSYDEQRRTFMIDDNDCNSKPRHLMAVDEGNVTAECKKLESKFLSIPHTMWWSIVTMTTVGYGDMAPVTFFGKMIASASMVLGIMFMAMPIAIVGSYFTVVVDVSAQKKIMQKTGYGEMMEGNLAQAGGQPSGPPFAGSSSLRPRPTMAGSLGNMGRAQSGGLLQSPPQSPSAPSSPRKAGAKTEVRSQMKIWDEKRRQSVAPRLHSGNSSLSLPVGSVEGDVTMKHVEQVEAGLMVEEGDPHSTLTFGERLVVFLMKVMPEYKQVWTTSSLVHHVDIWLDTHVPEVAADENTSFSMASPTASMAGTRTTPRQGRVRADTIMGVPTFGCLELLVDPEGGQEKTEPSDYPPKTVWLVRPMTFSVGAKCEALTDPDIVLASDAMGSAFARVAQRNSEFIISKWWSDKPSCLLRPTLPSRPSVNNVGLPPQGKILQHGDIIDFCPAKGPDEKAVRYRYRIDKYSLALQDKSFELSPGRLAELRGDRGVQRLRTLSSADYMPSPTAGPSAAAALPPPLPEKAPSDLLTPEAALSGSRGPARPSLRARTGSPPQASPHPVPAPPAPLVPPAPPSGETGEPQLGRHVSFGPSTHVRQATGTTQGSVASLGSTPQALRTLSLGQHAAAPPAVSLVVTQPCGAVSPAETPRTRDTAGTSPQSSQSATRQRSFSRMVLPGTWAAAHRAGLHPDARPTVEHPLLPSGGTASSAPPAAAVLLGPSPSPQPDGRASQATDMTDDTADSSEEDLGHWPACRSSPRPAPSPGESSPSGASSVHRRADPRRGAADGLAPRGSSAHGLLGPPNSAPTKAAPRLL